MKQVGRALFFRTGINDLVRAEIDRQQQRETQMSTRSAVKAKAGKAPAALERSGGRLMLRRPGYTFEPHLDPRRALLTALFYFGSPHDSHDHGTKLFKSNATVPEKHAGVYYPLREGASCAQPPTLERYAYQFYIGKE